MPGAVNVVMRVFGWPMVAVGAIMLVASAWITVAPVWTWVTGDTVEARIGTSTVVRERINPRGPAFLTGVSATFTARDGREYTVSDPMTFQGGGPDAGDRVHVAYDPDDPSDGVILALLPWHIATSVMLLVCGLGLLFTGGLFLLGARLPWQAS